MLSLRLWVQKVMYSSVKTHATTVRNSLTEMFRFSGLREVSVRGKHPPCKEYRVEAIDSVY